MLGANVVSSSWARAAVFYIHPSLSYISYLPHTAVNLIARLTYLAPPPSPKPFLWTDFAHDIPLESRQPHLPLWPNSSNSRHFPQPYNTNTTSFSQIARDYVASLI